MVYALVSSNADSVFKACGRQLWDFFVAHTVLNFVFLLFISCIVGCLNTQKNECVVVSCIFYLCYSIAMHSMSIYFALEATLKEECNAALSAVSSTKSPLLAQLTYVWTVYDVIGMILSISFIAAGVYQEHKSNAKIEEEQTQQYA